MANIIFNEKNYGQSLNYGWRKDPTEVQKILTTLSNPYFSTAGIHLKGTGVGKTVMLSALYKKLFGSQMPAQKQPAGTCVSRGWSRSVDYLEVVQMAIKGLPQEFKLISHAYIYGTCREIGGDLSWSDGAVGAWAAKAVSTVGVCTNEECSDKDAGYDDLAREWGAKGVPQKFKDIGKNRCVTVAMVSSADEARDALCNYYPISCCSGQGFTMTRDNEGHCIPEGSWSHCKL